MTDINRTKIYKEALRIANIGKNKTPTILNSEEYYILENLLKITNIPNISSNPKIKNCSIIKQRINNILDKILRGYLEIQNTYNNLHTQAIVYLEHQRYERDSKL
jgi:hypothetical protein